MTTKLIHEVVFLVNGLQVSQLSLDAYMPAQPIRLNCLRNQGDKFVGKSDCRCQAELITELAPLPPDDENPYLSYV
jgi:hypothetical protein